MTTPQFGTLFHFTHLDNLTSIVDADAILSDTEVSDMRALTIEAGEPEIKSRRRRQAVSCPPGGVVADYVPFYFAARSPMMFKISRGGVPTFAGDHRDLVYLVSDVDTVLDLELPFAVSDRNAAKAIADFSNDIGVLGNLNQRLPSCDFVDWSVMNSTYWNSNADHPDRMERRMAEFLVHRSMPLTGITSIGVQRSQMVPKIERVFAECELDIPISVQPGWYY